MTSLILEEVRHAFDGVVAVDGLSLQVGPGEIVCLLGPSGCGKTTSLRIAAGLETLQQGRVIIGDTVVADDRTSVPPEKRNIGMVFQDYALFPHLTARENVAFGLTGRPAAAARQAADEMLERVGLAAYGDQYPHALSGGEQQRVALARALAPRPRLMLLDEPFANLDVRLRDQVRDDSLTLLKEAGTAALLVTHDPEEAMRMADRIAVMRKGRIVQQGSPADLYTRPLDGFMVRFFNEVNMLNGIVKSGQVAVSGTPWAAPGLPDGTPVEILIRPEGIGLGPASGACCTTIAATVRRARLMGPYSLTVLRLADGSELTARTPGKPPEAGQQVRLHLDPEHVFVFPRSG